MSHHHRLHSLHGSCKNWSSVVILRAVPPETHPARVGLNLASTSKIGIEVMMSQFQDSDCFYSCSLQREKIYMVLSCHIRWLFWSPLLKKATIKLYSVSCGHLCPSYKPQVSHVDHISLVQPLVTAIQLMSYKARDLPTEPTGTWKIA